MSLALPSKARHQQFENTTRRFEEWYRLIRRSETSKGQFVEVKSPLGTAGPWAVEVEFPNGVRLRVRG